MQDPREGRCNGTFAVGAGDMDHLVAILRVSQGKEDALDGLKPQFDPESPEAVHGIETYCVIIFFIGHFNVNIH